MDREKQENGKIYLKDELGALFIYLGILSFSKGHSFLKIA